MTELSVGDARAGADCRRGWSASGVRPLVVRLRLASAKIADELGVGINPLH